MHYLQKTLRSFSYYLINLFYLFLLGLNPFSPAIAVPFSCDPSNTGLLVRGTETVLSEISMIDGSDTPLVPAQAGLRYNAVGFNVVDNLIYGMVNIPATNSNQLVRVEAGGTIDIFPAFTDPNFPVGRYLSGDVDISGIYHTLSQGTNIIRRVDVSTATPAVLAPIVYPSPMPTFSDFAFNPQDGNLYGFLSQPFGANPIGTLARINITGTPTVEILNTVLPAPFGGFGAVFFAPDGTMYAYNNGSITPPAGPGALYQVSDPSISNSPTATLIRSNVPSVQNNDGARCQLALTIDYGDAPASYGTTTATNGPSHGITPELFLGSIQTGHQYRRHTQCTVQWR